MTHVRKKLIVAGAILAAAVGYLAYQGVAAGRSFYLDVDPYLADEKYHAQRVRLRGMVARQDLKLDEADQVADFRLKGETRTLRVVYKGALPDMFRADAQVVVAGKMDAQGVFQADELLTKCASKYTEGEPPHEPEGPK